MTTQATLNARNDVFVPKPSRVALCALFTSFAAVACGGAAPTDGAAPSLADYEQAGAVTPQGGIVFPHCTPPAKLSCTSTSCFCVSPPPPPPVQRFQITPTFYVTNVIYAPPGKSSSINYSSSTSMGSSTSVSGGIKDDVKVTAEASGSFFGGASVNISAGIATGSSHTDALDISENFSQGYKKSGQVDRIDHNYDEIWFLMRPNVNVAFQPPSTTTASSISWTFAGGDGFNTDVLQFVYAGWLNNAMVMPADVKNTLDFYGVTPDLYPTLLAADPLFTGMAPNQAMDANRFDYIGEFPFEPPFTQGDQAGTQSFMVTQSTTHSNSTTMDLNYSVGFGVSASFDVGVFKSKLSIQDTWTWTNSSTNKTSSGSGTTDTFTVGQPAYGYTGPTMMHVWEDRIYQTYAFTLDWPQGESNLALGQPSWQSSDLPDAGGVAARANDGNTDGNFWDASVNHTDWGYVSGMPDWPGQYWYVDLGSERVIDAVNIFNRTDCCSERLSHYNVLAYDSMTGNWNVISNHANDDTTNVNFFHLPINQVRSQYVMLAKTDDNYLHVAEVEVMGF